MAILWLAKRHKTITAEPDLAMMRAGFAGTEANMKRLDVLAYVLVALIGASAVASGQWVRYPTEGIPIKPDGKPDLTAPRFPGGSTCDRRRANLESSSHRKMGLRLTSGCGFSFSSTRREG